MTDDIGTHIDDVTTDKDGRIARTMAAAARSPHVHALVEEWLKGGRGCNPDEQHALYAAAIADQDAYAASRLTEMRENFNVVFGDVLAQRDALAAALRAIASEGSLPLLAWLDEHDPEPLHVKIGDLRTLVARAALATLDEGAHPFHRNLR